MKNKISIIISVFFLCACNNQLFDPVVVDLASENQDIIQSPDQKVTEPDFQSIFNNVIQPQCMSCHEPGGRAESVPLATYQDLVSGLDVLVVPGDIDSSLFYQVMLPTARRQMPPPRSGLPPVSENNIEVIRLWIEMGAPEFSVD